MNLPNKLSLIRMGMIPFVVATMHLSGPWGDLAAMVLFGLAAFTDFLDGHIARKHNLVTNFGKFIDPVADKLLVLSTLVMLLAKGRIAPWIVVCVLARELMVDGLRLVVIEQGKVIAASKLGKMKTVSQIVCILLLMLPMALPAWLKELSSLWMVAAVIWSGADYFIKNGRYLKDAKAGKDSL